MKFQQSYILPEGEHPALTITVVVTQDGIVRVAYPGDKTPPVIVSILAAGIQAVAAQAVPPQAPKEEKPVNVSELFPNRKRETIIH